MISRIISIAVLVLLLVAWQTRWDYFATKTYANGVVRWKTDRWTGYKWFEYCGTEPYGSELLTVERPAYRGGDDAYQRAYHYRKVATNIWRALVAANCIWIITTWLILPIIKRRKEVGRIRNRATLLSPEAAAPTTPVSSAVLVAGPVCQETAQPVQHEISEPQGFEGAETDSGAFVINPWARFTARLVDWSIWGVLLCILLILSGESRLIRVLDWPPAVLGWITAASWIPIEAFLLSRWGTTPGKRLFRISVYNMDGSKLSFTDALLRSAEVFVDGCALGIPLVYLITFYRAYSHLKTHKITTWDQALTVAVRQKPVGVARILVALAIIYGLAFWGILANK